MGGGVLAPRRTWEAGSIPQALGAFSQTASGTRPRGAFCHGENVNQVSSSMPRWSTSNQTGVWWNVKVINNGESQILSFLSSNNKFRRPEMSASRVACLISSIPALIRWCDLMWLSAVESRLGYFFFFTQTLIIVVGRPCPYQLQFIFKPRLTCLTADCLKIPPHSHREDLYTERLITRNASKVLLFSGCSSISVRVQLHQSSAAVQPLGFMPPNSF